MENVIENLRQKWTNMFSDYVKELNKLYQGGKATEHSYRPALQKCLSNLLKGINVTNEPKRQRCGAPDYILSKNGIDVGYIEAKDIGVPLDRVERGGKDDDQWERYTNSLDNLILTDYLEFRFFVSGQRVDVIRIAEVKSGKIVADNANFLKLQNRLQDFGAFRGETIRSAKNLAEMMARKAALMRDVFYKAVTEVYGDDSSLKDQLTAFQTVLMHDMDEKQFADVYAQTIAYGLFTARLHEKAASRFSRAEAMMLIPKSNPFLRQLFHYVAGPDLDDRVVWIVDALCEVYRAADMKVILKDFGSATGQNDPVLHFYETFLQAYDPSLRKARGVWYTPEPVVKFIVRAVDDVLKTHFNLKSGIAHTGLIEIEVESQIVKSGKRTLEKRRVHKVQLLDVATGTGTFLAEVVKQIYSRFKGQEGMWSSYVEQNLLPRLHGFELLMASYAMCHMKLDLLLTESGYKASNPANPPRLSVYLTDSLEEHHPDTGTLFASWLSKEANEASRIKKEMPIMVALGNPPYSGISPNMNSWVARKKIEDYKFVDGKHINEKKHFLNDDYVQFIRLGEHYIEKNGEGVLAYITAHGYIDNPTFRGMRWHLLNTFDHIFVLDLHGNSNKVEVTPDGLPDQNVFDIQQGVSIIIAVRTSGDKVKSGLAVVKHAHLWGSRESKYEFLQRKRIDNVEWTTVQQSERNYKFHPTSGSASKEYSEGFCITELFKSYTTGVQTSRDQFLVSFSKEELEENISYFCDQQNSNQEVRDKLFSKTSPKYPPGDTRDWKVPDVRKSSKKSELIQDITEYAYRPFDLRYICYSEKLCAWSRMEVGRNLLYKNVSLITARSNKSGSIDQFFVANHPSDVKCGERTTGSVFCPLYIYDDDSGEAKSRRPNFDPGIYKIIQKQVKDVTPQTLFDYIYAVLHSREYRERYAESLKLEFPRVPYPTDQRTFHDLASKGAELRNLHLMDSARLDDLITSYPTAGSNEVELVRWEPRSGKSTKGRVWINRTQYFDGVPMVAWEFQIGGYQPAQKWLKDRRTRTLNSNDLLHYQRVICALTNTDEVMDEIDEIDFLP